jgi:hypothetical protein
MPFLEPMTKHCLFAAVLLLACSGDPAPRHSADAQATLEAYLAASEAEDWPGLYALIAEESLEGQTPEAFTEQQERGSSALSRAIQSRTRTEIVGVTIDGDRAKAHVQMELPDLRAVFTPSGRPSTVAVKNAPLRQVEREVDLVWEQGAWKVIRPAVRRSSVEKRGELRQKLREEADRAAERMGQDETRE